LWQLSQVGAQRADVSGLMFFHAQNCTAFAPGSSKGFEPSSVSASCSGCIPIDGNERVNHPQHYTSHPSGVECIDVVEHMSFNLGNACKYIWRAGLKSKDPAEDLRKAIWYVNREIGRLSKEQK
jgi:hypothetical protein